jgi:hypothetical protein
MPRWTSRDDAENYASPSGFVRAAAGVTSSVVSFALKREYEARPAELQVDAMAGERGTQSRLLARLPARLPAAGLWGAAGWAVLRQ